MDLGTDAALSAKYAREHALALHCLHTGNMHLGSDVSHGTLAELMDQGVTCCMLAQRLPWRELARRFGVQALLDAGLTWQDMVCSGFVGQDLPCMSFAQLQQLGVTADDLLACRPSMSDVGKLCLHAHELQALGLSSVRVLRDGLGATPATLRCLNLTLPELNDIIGEPLDWKSDLGFSTFNDALHCGWPADDLYTIVFKPAAAPAAAPPPAAAPAPAAAPPGPVHLQKLVF